MGRARLLTVAAAAILCSLAPMATAQTRGARLLPGTRGDVFTLIQGNALTSTNGFLADATMRLRDARVGRIVQVTTTDKVGYFSFPTIDPGSYVVELIGSDHTILASSQLLNVNAGDTVSAIVKLPFRMPRTAGVFGHSAPAAAVVTATALASGVLALQVAGSDVTPRK